MAHKVKLSVFIIMVIAMACPLNAAIIVAASNSLPEEKAKADLVCDGKDDQVELLEAIGRAPQVITRAAGQPDDTPFVKWQGKHAVTWLPGDYYVSETMEFPRISDFALHAEGSYLHFLPEEGDIIHINHSIRCRYYFGTIDTKSKGVAITITGTTMSIIGFTGLIGHNQVGTGLRLYGTSTNKIEGTDIAGFDVGILVDDVAAKLDTNWFWISYIRNCNTCIWEKGRNVDDNVWYVNVDATLPGSVAIRTGATYGWWHIIMGTYKFEGKNNAIILDPGATDNVMFIQPPLKTFAWEDNSGNESNTIMSSGDFRALMNLVNKDKGETSK